MSGFPPDFAIEWDGQLYTPVGSHEHPTRTGGTMTLLDWRTNCPRCGVEFIASTPTVFKTPTRRCADCRSPGRRVSTDRKLFRAQIRGDAS